MAEHLDLEGMSPRDAKSYVMQYVAALKKVQREREELRREFDKWEERARLAEQKGRDDLHVQALTRCREISEKHERLGEEERTLDTDVRVLKKNLQRIQKRPERTVNAEALLDQLEQVTGSTEESQTTEQFSQVELDEQLKELKRKLGGDQGSDEKTS